MQAMHISTLTNPPINEKLLNRTMQVWEEKLDGKIVILVSPINLNTDKWVEEAMDTLKQASTIGAMVMEFQFSDQRL